MAVYLSVNSSEIVKFLLNTNDGRGGRPDWAILSSTYALAKILERGGVGGWGGGIPLHCLYGQLLLTRF